MNKTIEMLHSISYKDFDSSLIIPESIIIEELGKFTNLDERDKYGRTILLYSCFYCRNEVIAYLIKNGANVNAQDKEGISPLHATVNNNNLYAVRALLNAGADINLKDVYGNKPIAKLKHYDSEEIAKILIESGANPYEKNNYGISKAERMINYPNIISIFEKYYKP